MESKLKSALNKLKVQTCRDSLRSIFAYLDTWDLLRYQRLNSYMMHVILLFFTKIRKNPNLIWVINLEADYLHLDYFQKSKILSLVTLFEINVPDLACLMILPDILTVIQEKLLEDRRLLVEFDLQPRVVLTNNLGKFFIEDVFDQFELANKFNLLSRNLQDLQMLTIENEMDIVEEESRRILFNLLLAFENIFFDKSILFSYDEKFEKSDMNIEIIDQIIEKSLSLQINYWAYEIIAQTRKFVNKTVKNLKMYYQYIPLDESIPFTQVAQKFQNLETLDVAEIGDDEEDFFACYEAYFNSELSKNLKFFKANFQMCNDQEYLRSEMQYLFKIIIGIEVPKIELEFCMSCRLDFLDKNRDPAFYDIFDNYKVYRRFFGFPQDQQINQTDDFMLYMTFKKNIVDEQNKYKYTFDFKFKYR